MPLGKEYKFPTTVNNTIVRMIEKDVLPRISEGLKKDYEIDVPVEDLLGLLNLTVPKKRALKKADSPAVNEDTETCQHRFTNSKINPNGICGKKATNFSDEEGIHYCTAHYNAAVKRAAGATTKRTVKPPPVFKVGAVGKK